MTTDLTAIREMKSKRSKCADIGNIDLSNVPESHETIWMQWGDNGGDDDTWCASNVNDEDVPYIRADLVHSLCDALDELRAEIERLQTIIRNLHTVEGKHRETANAHFHRANQLQVENERLQEALTKINVGDGWAAQIARAALAAMKTSHD